MVLKLYVLCFLMRMNIVSREHVPSQSMVLPAVACCHLDVFPFSFIHRADTDGAELAVLLQICFSDPASAQTCLRVHPSIFRGRGMIGNKVVKTATLLLKGKGG